MKNIKHKYLFYIICIAIALVVSAGWVVYSQYKASHFICHVSYIARTDQLTLRSFTKSRWSGDNGVMTLEGVFTDKHGHTNDIMLTTFFDIKRNGNIWKLTSTRADAQFEKPIDDGLKDDLDQILPSFYFNKDIEISFEATRMNNSNNLFFTRGILKQLFCERY